ncbi:hypothetical protein [Phytohabitans kaempferiae]|uniref:Uncharacterized protein n=1 Tax=Phytohabitans kaempferiae TaxID=1620943 RepID=A0ABV6MF62_9ACTN
MRIVRTAAGMLLLTIGLPVLLVGGALWTAMQHRDGDGAFSGRVERITTPGHAVVVPDLDALLRREAPFTRARDTRLRVTAETEAGPALVGIAPATDVARYLAGVAYAQVDRVSLTSGPLPVRVTPVEGTAVPAAQPAWQAAGTGAVAWDSAQVRGQHLALVVMHPDGQAGMTVDLRVEVRPGWLAPATWGLLVAGAVLIVLGMATLAWPVRRPAAPRPATLADVLPPPAPPQVVTPQQVRPGWAAPTPMPVQPILTWPPHPSVGVTPAPLPAPSSPSAPAREQAPGVLVASGVAAPRGAGLAAGDTRAAHLRDADLGDTDIHGADPRSAGTDGDADLGNAGAGDVADLRDAGAGDGAGPGDAELPEFERAEVTGPDLPGSADLASALGSLGAKSRSTRRRKTAAGLPTDASPAAAASPSTARRARRD